MNESYMKRKPAIACWRDKDDVPIGLLPPDFDSDDIDWIFYVPQEALLSDGSVPEFPGQYQYCEVRTYDLPLGKLVVLHHA